MVVSLGRRHQKRPPHQHDGKHEDRQRLQLQLMNSAAVTLFKEVSEVASCKLCRASGWSLQTPQRAAACTRPKHGRRRSICGGRGGGSGCKGAAMTSRAPAAEEEDSRSEGAQTDSSDSAFGRINEIRESPHFTIYSSQYGPTAHYATPQVRCISKLAQWKATAFFSGELYVVVYKQEQGLVF